MRSPILALFVLSGAMAQDRPRVDANGWPVVTPEKPVNAKPVRTDFDQPPTTSDVLPAPAAPGGAGPVAAPSAIPASRPTTGAKAALDSQLTELFRFVGYPSALAELRGVIARIQIRVLDTQGADLGVIELFHEAELGHLERDRLVFATSRKIYGRDGTAAWAKQHNMLWPALEQEARDELAMHGMLLRVPWVFADRQFAAALLPSSDAKVRHYVVRPTEVGELVGPAQQSADQDRYEILAHADSGEPFELRYYLATTKQTRRVLLEDWRPFGSVKMPMKRVVLDPAGRRLLEITVQRLEVGQQLPPSQFSAQG